MMVVFMALEEQCCGMVVEVHFKGKKIQKYSASIIQTESEAVIGDEELTEWVETRSIPEAMQ